MYPSELPLLLNGEWWRPTDPDSFDSVLNPATGREIGRVPRIGVPMIAAAARDAEAAFQKWRLTPANTRYRLLRKAAGLLRSRRQMIAEFLAQEQGKPVPEAVGEIALGAEVIDWIAEEARRTYGRVIPSRRAGVQQIVVREPIGAVAAFTPWNFPINQSVRKVAAAIGAGCSVILKAPEEAPASSIELIRCFVDAGAPHGVVNLMFGPPAVVSEILIAHPSIRKVSFTGSTAVGRLIAAKAGSALKPVTLELGGHAPVIICSDADLSTAVPALLSAKFLNAGQVCTAPTRFLVHDSLIDDFATAYLSRIDQLIVGSAEHAETTMGPLVSQRRVKAVHDLVTDAIQHGAALSCGGYPLHGPGNFYAPTVLRDAPTSARIMNEEPFGPVAVLNSFTKLVDAIAEANRLPYGLAAYAYTDSASAAAKLVQDIECGMLSINHNGLSLPETPFGGVKSSGHGSEGGSEALDPYTVIKFVSQFADPM